MTVTAADADPLHDALVQFTGCVGEALEGVCSYGLTVGETYVPFEPDPEDDCPEEDSACSQAWVRVMNVNVTDVGEGFDGGDCSASLRLSLEVGVLRCFDIEEGGAAPTATEVLIAALQSTTDMKAIYCAAMSCDVWDAINAGTWVPMGPMGGQYGGTWTFDVTVD